MNFCPDTDVLIVGAGPTGLMMACQLCICHIPFRIIDRTLNHTTQSRALVIQARSLEILDQMGIAEKAIQQGKVAKGIGAFFNGKKMLHVTVSNMGSGLTKFPYLLMLEQSHTEKILIDFLEEHGHYVERNTELQNITPSDDEVISVLKFNDGTVQTQKTKYLVGADGASSIVREQLKIPFRGKTYHQSLFVLDCMVEVALPHDEMDLAFSDKSFGGLFPLTNGRWRILGNLPQGLEGKTEITFEDIEKTFSKNVRLDMKLFDPKWISVYHSHHRYASTFRKDRCFLAGDSAHIHSPVGGQGMNTGLQDAYNLAWKLSLVLKGKADPLLLNTYTDERISIARKLVHSTDRVFNVVTSRGIFLRIFRLYLIPPVLRVAGPVFQKLKIIQKFAFRMISEIGIHYRKSVLSKDASSGQFPGYAPKPGDRLPFIQFYSITGEQTNIQEKVKGTFFCLLLFCEIVPSDLTNAIEAYKDMISIRVIAYKPETEILYKQFGIKTKGYYLTRPDTYIGCRANTMDTEHIRRYLSRFLYKDGNGVPMADLFTNKTEAGRGLI